MAQEPDGLIVNNRTANRFELAVDGAVAEAQYMLDGATIYLTHTEVPPAMRGRGVAQRLARAAFEHARAERLRVVTLCPFMRRWARQHPEYGELLRSEW
jgi:predicted GNAT family acetyltransferase